MFIAQSATAAMSAAVKLLITNPFTKYVTVHRSTAFMTKVKSPSVRMLMGKVSIINIGLITALKMPKKRATIKAVWKEATFTPGTY